MYPSTGLCWVCIGKGSYYINTRLPFGLTSAPKLFHGLGRHSTVADKTSSRVCPELDDDEDDLFVEAPHKPATALWIAIKTLSKLSIPLAPKKVERLSTKLELDSDSMMAWLPEDKLGQLKAWLHPGTTGKPTQKFNCCT